MSMNSARDCPGRAHQDSVYFPISRSRFAFELSGPSFSPPHACAARFGLTVIGAVLFGRVRRVSGLSFGNWPARCLSGRVMDLISVLIVLIIVGVCLYLVTTYIPMAPPIKTVITVVVVLVLCLWLLQIFGITGPHLPVARYTPR